MTKNEQIRLTKKRWLVLVSSCLINLCIGSLYVWSVFAGPMAAHLSEVMGDELTAANLAIVFSIGNSSGFITMIGGGFLNEKLGVRRVVMLGGILFGAGFVICGFAQSMMGLIVGYGIVSGLAMGLAYGCTISNSVKFFPDKAGLAGGIATASYGISSVILPPVANALIEQVGVSKAFLYFGIVIIFVTGIFSQFLIKCPEDFVPIGYKCVAEQSDEIKKAGEERDKNWKEMLASPIFYVMLIMLFFGAVLGMMAISQASAIAQNMVGMTAANAALIVSVLALFNTFGRILAGSVSDRIGFLKTLQIVFVLALVSMIFLYVNGGAVMFCVGICMVGLCFGAFMGVYPGFTARQFGRKNSSVNYGIMFIGFNLAGLLGPIFIGRIYGATKEYRSAFVMAMAFALIGLTLTFVYQKLEKEQFMKNKKSC